MLEELLARGHGGAEYDAWLIRDQRGRPVRQRLRRRQSEFQDPGADGPQRSEADPGVRVRRDPAVPGREVRRLPADRARRRAPSACRGCSGRWAPRPISAAASATSTPMRRPRSNTRSTASPWRRSASSTCSTGAWREREYIAGDEYTIADMAIWPWYGATGEGRHVRCRRVPRRCRTTSTCIRWTDQIAERPAVKRGRMVNRACGEPADQLRERHDASDFETAHPGQAGGGRFGSVWVSRYRSCAVTPAGTAKQWRAGAGPSGS